MTNSKIIFLKHVWILLIMCALMPSRVFASCYVDADLSCQVKATNLAWSKGQTFIARNFLFNTAKVQNDYSACKNFAKLIQSECQFEMPITSVFYTPQKDKADVISVTDLTSAKDPNMSSQNSLPDEFKKYFNGDYDFIGDKNSLTNASKAITNDQISAIQQFVQPTNSSQFLALNVQCNMGSQSNAAETVRSYINNNGCAFAYSCQRLGEKGLGERLLIQKLDVPVNDSVYQSCSANKGFAVLISLMSVIYQKRNESVVMNDPDMSFQAFSEMPLISVYNKGLSKLIADKKKTATGGLLEKINQALDAKKYYNADAWAHFEFGATLSMMGYGLKSASSPYERKNPAYDPNASVFDKDVKATGDTDYAEAIYKMAVQFAKNNWTLLNNDANLTTTPLMYTPGQNDLPPSWKYDGYRGDYNPKSYYSRSQILAGYSSALVSYLKDNLKYLLALRTGLVLILTMKEGGDTTNVSLVVNGMSGKKVVAFDGLGRVYYLEFDTEKGLLIPHSFDSRLDYSQQYQLVALVSSKPWPLTNLGTDRTLKEYQDYLKQTGYQTGGYYLSDDSKKCSDQSVGKVNLDSVDYYFKLGAAASNVGNNFKMNCMSLFTNDGFVSRYTGTMDISCQDGVVSVVKNNCGDNIDKPRLVDCNMPGVSKCIPQYLWDSINGGWKTGRYQASECKSGFTLQAKMSQGVTLAGGDVVVQECVKKPTIIVQPQDKDVTVYDSFDISVSADGNGLDYEWHIVQKNSQGQDVDNTLSDLFNNKAIDWKQTIRKESLSSTSLRKSIETFHVSTEGYKVYVIVSNAAGSVQSRMVVIKPMALQNGLVQVKKPVIQRQLQIIQTNYSDKVNPDYVTLSIEATGGRLSYDWYKDNKLYWSSSTSSTFSTPTPGDYKVIIKNTVGTTESATVRYVKAEPVVTVTAVAAVTESKPTIITQPNFSGFVTAGNSVILQVKASGGNLKYLWYKDGKALNLNVYGEDTGFAKEENYIILKAKSDDSGKYKVVVTNSKGSVTSNEIGVDVRSAPVIKTQPTVSKYYQAGKSLSLEVTATGGSLTYQWHKLLNGLDTAIAGATSNKLNISNLKLEDASSYSVEIKNNIGTTQSEWVDVVVEDIPKIIKQPAMETNTVAEGMDVSLTVQASGGRLKYQWSSDSGTMTGENSETLKLAAVKNSGNYRVSITNDLGNVISNYVSVVVRPVGTKAYACDYLPGVKKCSPVYDSGKIIQSIAIDECQSGYTYANSYCYPKNINLSLQPPALKVLSSDKVYLKVPLADMRGSVYSIGWYGVDSANVSKHIGFNWDYSSSSYAFENLNNSIHLYSLIDNSEVSSPTVYANFGRLQEDTNFQPVRFFKDTNVYAKVRTSSFSEKKELDTTKFLVKVISAPEKPTILSALQGELYGVTDQYWDGTKTVVLQKYADKYIAYKVIRLNVLASGGGLTYDWYKGNVLLVSGKENYYDIVVTDSSQYKVIVKNSAGSVESSLSLPFTKFEIPMSGSEVATTSTTSSTTTTSTTTTTVRPVSTTTTTLPPGAKKTCSMAGTIVPDGVVASGYTRDKGDLLNSCSSSVVVKKCNNGVWDHPEAPYWSCTSGK